MIGLVVCGGKSSRMQQDKGLLLRNNITWAAHAFDLLQLLNIPVHISINAAQQKAYSNIFSKELLIVDDATIPIGGPLSGLLSAFTKYPAQDIFVLACDMPLMRIEPLRYLLDNYQQQTIVYKQEQQIEPLCGIYSASALESIHQLINTQQLQKQSMMHCLERIQAGYIQVPILYLSCFANINTNEALQHLGNP
jgi:molybdenum cofactor guanylyltransferase